MREKLLYGTGELAMGHANLSAPHSNSLAVFQTILLIIRCKRTGWGKETDNFIVTLYKEVFI